MLIDSFGRTIDYLRLAVTDKCNLRCRYCMPEEGIDFSKNEDLLSLSEIARLAEVFGVLGINKVRLTGGEPFMRKDILQVLEVLSLHFKNINLTTNATLIQPYMHQLKQYNISSFNISIDSLHMEKFFAITKRDQFETVYNTIWELYDMGFRVKLNVVVMKGINETEIAEFCLLAKNHKVDVRFIEAMPFNAHDGNESQFLSLTEIEEHIINTFPSLQKVDSPRKSSSIKYSIDGFVGNIGIIPAYSRSLCGMCNRIRLTPEGQLLTCLYADQGINLRDLIRDGFTNEQLIAAIKGEVMQKAKDGFEAESNRVSDSSVFQSMTTIGG